MKKTSSPQKLLIIASSMFILGIILLFTICFCIFGFRILSSKPLITATTQTSTITPIPLPSTVQEVKSQCSKGECLNACMAHANIEIQKERLNSYQYNGDDINLAFYGISNEDNLEKPRMFNVQAEFIPYQQNEAAHKTIWNYYKALIPRESRPNLVTFGIFLSSTTLGYFDTTATENWITVINILSLEDISSLSSVEIHEYGHYLTLNNSQQTPSSEFVCHQEALYGCQTADSYINHFYLEFWQDIYPEWEKIRDSSKDYDQDIKLFYDTHKSMFINEYASTNPLEDIAESWTAFILAPTPSNNSITDQKINFFYQFPELVELRFQIIKGICTYKQAP